MPCFLLPHSVQALDSYLKVNDFASALKWTDRLSELKSDQPTDYQKSFNTKVDPNYIRLIIFSFRLYLWLLL